MNSDYSKINKSTFLSSFKISDFFWLLLFNLLIFQGPIQSATGFSYIDECVTVAAFISYVCSNLVGMNGNKEDFGVWAKRCIVLLGLFVIAGLISNAFSGVDAAFTAISIDFFTCIKYPVCFICFVLYFRDNHCLYDVILSEIKLLLVAFLIFGVLNIFFSIGDFGADDPRFGFKRSFQFVFGHPEGLVFVCVGFLLILVHDYARNRTWLLISLFVICLTLRTKGIAFVGVALLLLFTWGHRGRLRLSHVLLGLLSAVLIGWDQFQSYYQGSGYARNELTRVAFVLANKYFPLGTGFATFGSNITGDPKYYSSLYYQYRLNTVWGLYPGEASFLSDVFWPTVMAQFGWVGLFVYVVMLGCLIVFAYKKASSPGHRLSVILSFVFLLISSTAESAFFNPYAVFLAFCLALTLKIPVKSSC